MKQVVVCGLTILFLLVFLAGCSAISPQYSLNSSLQEHPDQTAVIHPETDYVASHSTGEEIPGMENTTNEKSLKNLKIGETREIKLNENPSTGYSWNVTVTDGLEIIGNTFSGPENNRRMGAGGVRVWTIKATGTGNQTFSGVYRQSWRPAGDLDITYVQEFIVTE
ncbi:MAG: protease inhibitor I42 family protein [Methanospirillum sp.]|nr:protease inhibitor I42 family protein [Methanospirillum sp.]